MRRSYGTAGAGCWVLENEEAHARVSKPCPESLNGSVSMGSSSGYRELISTSLQLTEKKSWPQDLL